MPNMTNLQKVGAEIEPPPKDEKQEDLQQAGDQQDEAAAEAEKEASAYGWVPKDTFKGNPDDWVDAAAFIKRGKEINPILRKNNERLLKELQKSTARINELELTQKEFGEMYKKMSDNAYKRAIDEVKSQIKQARKDDDQDAVEDLEEQRDKLVEESKTIKVPGTSAADPAAALKAERDAIMNQWAADNASWYDRTKNPTLYFLTDGIANDFARTPEGRALVGKREFLDRVTELVKEAMPEAFKNPRRKAGSPVNGTSTTRSDGRSDGKKSYADLPADAKAICDRQVKNIPGFTRDKYVQFYFEQEGA